MVSMVQMDGVYGVDGLPRDVNPFGEKGSRLGASALFRSKVENPAAVSLQVFTRSKRISPPIVVLIWTFPTYDGKSCAFLGWVSVRCGTYRGARCWR